MSHRVILLTFAFACIPPLVSVSACGGARTDATQAANPSAAAPTETAAPAASTAAGAPSAIASPTSSAEAPAPSSGASSAPAAPAEPSGPPGPGDWDKWSHEQKLAYMKSTVMPKMGAIFHDFDAKTFAEPKCVLCHGDGVKDGTFTMPNPQLPKLDLSPAGMKALRTKHKKVFELMTKQVVPTMASLLAEQPFDPKTGQGFGCSECHTKK